MRSCSICAFRSKSSHGPTVGSRARPAPRADTNSGIPSSPFHDLLSRPEFLHYLEAHVHRDGSTETRARAFEAARAMWLPEPRDQGGACHRDHLRAGKM